ncbi:MAG TPA: M23 family metallopeptidase [Longimicrobiales bacterium]|nr:M23 family metallopeptidase [Longimicrobiales bacterium]
MLRELGKASRVLDAALANAGQSPPVRQPDARPADIALGYLLMRSERLETALDAARDTQLALNGLCATAQPFRTTAAIASIDDAAGVVVLGDVTRLAITPYASQRPFSERQQAVIEGVGRTITKVEPLLLKFFPGLFPAPCLALRIAPIQPFGPPTPATLTLLEPTAYESLGVLFLEASMRLAVMSLGCDVRLGTRHSVQLDLFYKNCQGHQAAINFAYDLDQHDAPIPLPCLDPLSAATLVVKHRRQFCPPGGDCGPFTPGPTEQYKLLARPDRDYAAAVYSSTFFTLEDDDATSFQTASVAFVDTGTFYAADPGTTPVFEAEGYAVNGGVSTFPSAVSIFLNQPFAIFNHDFFDPDALFAQETTGVVRPSGLRWPRVFGIRNGSLFQYSADVPPIIRDGLAECSGSVPDCLYRVPFAGGFPRFIAQGNSTNDPTASHCIVNENGDPCIQRYAFDFGAALSTPILAARGGTVIAAESQFVANCANTCGTCPGTNLIFILHQDGTLGQYFHMEPGGVFVSQGAKVLRGDLIGSVGNTGCSSGPHLHFHVVPNAGELFTMPISFQTLAGNLFCVPNLPTLNCQVPAAQSFVCSNTSP